MPGFAAGSGSTRNRRRRGTGAAPGRRAAMAAALAVKVRMAFEELSLSSDGLVPWSLLVSSSAPT